MENNLVNFSIFFQTLDQVISLKNYFTALMFIFMKFLGFSICLENLKHFNLNYYADIQFFLLIQGGSFLSLQGLIKKAVIEFIILA